MLFSRRHTGSGLVGKIGLFGKYVELSSQVKYLGVMMDSNINWIALPSKAILWLYEKKIRPMLSHGCVVWWHMLDKEVTRKAPVDRQLTLW